MPEPLDKRLLGDRFLRKEVTIPDTYRLDFTSGVNGRRYSISVALPTSAAPPVDGYRVLYVLDGYFYFASAAEAVRAHGDTPDVVVVGIGYPDDASYLNGVLSKHSPLPASLAERSRASTAYILERLYDLTLPADEEYLASQRVKGLFAPTADHVGGLDDFLATLATEIKPRIAKALPVNSTYQAIFGHSLGGLAVIHLLFTDPHSFRVFIAASPSLWWNHRAVEKNEALFGRVVESGGASPQALITMGGDEDALPKLPAKLGVDSEGLIRLARDRHMIENARELTSRLQRLRGSSPYHVEDYTIFPDQGHGISPWPALGRAISFAFVEAR